MHPEHQSTSIGDSAEGRSELTERNGAHKANPYTNSRIRLFRAFRVAVLLGGIMLPVVATTIALWPNEAEASANCSSHYGTTGHFGSIDLYNYLTGFGDPACTGSRYRAMEYIAVTYPATNIDFIGFEPSVGVREWDCGGQVYGGYGGAGGVPGIEAWSEWVTGYNTCSFQADQNVKFVKSGYSDFWQYKAY